MRIAIQGERGSFSHQAALRLVPDFAELQACSLSPEVFARVVDGRADAAVIPIENSLAGSVLEHYDLLLAHPVHIEAELLLRIRHQLIAAPGTSLDAVREVFSHPVALAQCRNFFVAYPALRAMPFYDTAGSAAHAVVTGGIAAIASEQAAAEYGGEILAAGIEDHTENYTRFLLVRADATASPDVPGVVQSDVAAGNKVSLAFAVQNKPGALVEALAVFARHGLNLSRLESRPVPGTPWEYVFYADYRFTTPTAALLALGELRALCSFVKELGRYMTAVPGPELPR
ncbi:prephenate dehydratase domain-containing protein [Acidipila sp. EB88]|uniref:prephenate dehydratase n=1 Tax=Acidipila sp. EB88 TaxID=2305226 RepID=UPI000F5F8A95|nr:prephenate dehydratase domain-containing protein [Acidipila sp. EB88]RRA47290.1 ACT domain-containing protein [Acidipila sp. EB88]